jgi:hypothetical protein
LVNFLQSDSYGQKLLRYSGVNLATLDGQFPANVRSSKEKARQSMLARRVF